MTPTPVVVVDVVGMTPRLLGHMPRMRALAADGFQARLDPVLPALTCPVQSTILTGLDPAGHGIVGNGWYFRDLGEVLLWRQHNRLVQGEKVWEAARGMSPGYTAANLCWWYAMGATTDITLTPRPVYHADGRKSPDCYTDPPALRDELTRELGRFPLFSYWGPGAGIESSRWIAAAGKRVLERESPDLLLTYLPHLDYDLQRFGPDGTEAVRAALAVDEVAGELVDFARARGATVVVLSEYGITAVSRPVDINRRLRRAGLLRVYTQEGMEYLDPWASEAFAVADHQIAHVYVRDARVVGRVCELLSDLEGVELVLDREGKAAAGLDHPRAGELVAIADRDAWFTYYYWLEDDSAPDFARTVEIHRKPGYDPAELFMDPGDRLVKLRAARALARRQLGLRYLLDVVPLDPSCVRGSHGRLPPHPDDGPILICSDSSAARDAFAAREVKSLLVELARGAASGRRRLRNSPDSTRPRSATSTPAP
ncbi:MAG: alkaline phosphatase family protein [Solirubrobacteraceae bacterium]